MYIGILSIFVAFICLVIHKKKSAIINRVEVIKQILWLEAVFFLIVYFITDSHWYKSTWLIFLLLASLFNLYKRK